MNYIDSTRTHLVKTEDADRAWSYCGRVFEIGMVHPTNHYCKQTCAICKAAYESEETAIASARQMKEHEERQRMKAWNDAALGFALSSNAAQPVSGQGA